MEIEGKPFMHLRPRASIINMFNRECTMIPGSLFCHQTRETGSRHKGMVSKVSRAT